MITFAQQMNLEMLKRRRVALEIEANRRIQDREYHDRRTIENFFARNPDLKDRLPLFACIAPWTQQYNPDKALEELLPLAGAATRKVVQSESQANYGGAWFGVFSEVVTLADGQKVNYADYVAIELASNGDQLSGEGVLFTGHKFRIEGRNDGGKFIGEVVNMTEKWNAKFSCDLASTKISGPYSGAGAGQTYEGTVMLLR